MFWNSEFINSSPSHIDVLLQIQTIKLGDILYEEDLLQELKTYNSSLINFLARPEVINELVDNIIRLTEKDCCDKLLYSRVHAAYISCEILTAGIQEIFTPMINNSESLGKIINCLIDLNSEPSATKVVPQKATLVNKLISTIHSSAAVNLSCYVTQDISSFNKFIDVLVNNIDVSGSFELLSTFISRTSPPETRYVFCEILSKLNFVYNLIDVMTASDFEDKQRNACQLLCDILVIGRQEASEQLDSGPFAQDMLYELIESSEAVHKMLSQMFLGSTTAIVSGIKVLGTLLDHKSITSTSKWQAESIEQIQVEIEKYLDKFNELLLNPPKQEPIKTTFGIIQKPLGYTRLEVVSLIRALLSTNSNVIIKKLVDLKTMKIIIDLFMDYSWNNLLHTQVEQALCLIINNCRRDEDLSVFGTPSNENNHEENMSHENDNNNENKIKNNFNNGNENNIDNNMENNIDIENGTEEDNENEIEHRIENKNVNNNTNNNNNNVNNNLDNNINEDLQEPASPSRALLSQLLNECDLIGRLLSPNTSDNANFGHIIQMINSIAINRDLDTIRDHLDEMEKKRPELFDRWTRFVTVDVASFKEISLYYDAQSASNNVTERFGQHNQMSEVGKIPLNTLNSNNISATNNEDEMMPYLSFTRETVIPTINVHVVPKTRRSKNAH